MEWGEQGAHALDLLDQIPSRFIENQVSLFEEAVDRKRPGQIARACGVGYAYYCLNVLPMTATSGPKAGPP